MDQSLSSSWQRQLVGADVRAAEIARRRSDGRSRDPGLIADLRGEPGRARRVSGDRRPRADLAHQRILRLLRLRLR